MQGVRNGDDDVEVVRRRGHDGRRRNRRARVLERQPRAARIPAVREAPRALGREGAAADVLGAAFGVRAPHAASLPHDQLLLRRAVDKREDAAILTVEDELISGRRDL